MNIKIIYGTTMGNTQIVIETIAEHLRQSDRRVTIERAELSNPEDLTKNTDLLILASPTYAHGELEEKHFQPFFDKIQDADLLDIYCAAIGLGDDKYDDDYNMESATIIEEYFTAQKGEIIIPALKMNKSPIAQLKSKVIPWADKLLSAIDKAE